MESYQKKQWIYKSILITVIAMCITFLAAYYYAYYNMENNYFFVTGKMNKESEESVDNVSTALKDFRKLIDEYYIWDIDEDKVLDETIKGYVNGLGDEYSEYMTAEDWEEYQTNALGNYVGIGIYMGQDKNDNVVIISPMEESPAEAADLQAGDVIVEVDGESVAGQDTSTVASKVKGEEGTTVNLKIERDNEYKNVDVERKAIKVYHVKGEMKENSIGYIKLSTFDEGCSNEFKTEFEKIQEQGAQKLIIDLRDNTGGLVEEALQIADMMLPKGDTMLITVDNKGNREVNKSKNAPIINMDIVVLVNGYSASASEILVGALKDNERAKIIGTKTYGKGVIQNVFSLADGSVLKLTTAEYQTPNEVKIHKIGIEPDEVVELVEEPKGEPEIDEQLNRAMEILKQ